LIHLNGSNSRLEIVMRVSMKMVVYWNMRPRSQATQKMEEAVISITSAVRMQNLMHGLNQDHVKW
jgi:hypothetical protein